MRRAAFVLVTLLGLLSVRPATAASCFSAGVDYLYWHAIQSNMSYGVVANDMFVPDNLKVLNQSTDNSSAFRLGVGYSPPCLCWDIDFSWTRFHNTAFGSTDEPNIIANQLLGQSSTFIVGGAGTGGPASSRWRLNLDMFDLNFSLPICDCYSCQIAPYFGLKGGRIDQNELIRYNDFLNTNTGNRVEATVDQNNDFWGIGPKAGIEGLYRIACGFSLVGDFSMAAAYGEFCSRKQISQEELGVVTVGSSESSYNKLIPILQLFIGLDWSRLCCRGLTLSVGAGYEIQYYWNTWRTQNSAIQDLFVTNAGFGDLMLHGLTVKFGVGY